MRAWRRISLLLAASLAMSAGLARAQKPEEKPAEKPAPKQPPLLEPGESSSKRPPEEGQTTITPGETNPAPQPKFDPLRAEKSIEVGRYYMRTHDYDAAIDRFKDAIDARPTYALPYRLLAEAQEKKKLYRAAVESYESYLEVYPSAADAEKVKKKIAKLKVKMEKRNR